MVTKLSQLTSLLSSIEDKVKALLHEGPESPHRRSLIPPVTFEVKAESLGIPQKLQLKVDVESGKLIVKKSKDGSEDKFYSHKKILQLIKSQKFLNKLVILVETEKEKTLRKEYVFADSKKREGFCQLLQQMKNKHSEQPEPDMITIFIGTWNMGAGKDAGRLCRLHPPRHLRDRHPGGPPGREGVAGDTQKLPAGNHQHDF